MREKGYSKEKAARIANTPDSGEKASKYEERTYEELYDLAQEIGIKGRSKLNKKALIKALRNN